MGDRTKTIKIRVTPDEKREYEEYIEETGEAPSASSWFRTLANERVSADDEATADIDLESLTEAMEVALSDVHEQMETMANRMASLESNVHNDDDIDKLAREIYSHLPVMESPDEFPDPFLEVDINLADRDLEEAQKISTPSAWAKWFDKSEADIRRACARMLEYYPDARYFHEKFEDASGVVEAPARRYYKTEEI